MEGGAQASWLCPHMAPSCPRPVAPGILLTLAVSCLCCLWPAMLPLPDQMCHHMFQVEPGGLGTNASRVTVGLPVTWARQTQSGTSSSSDSRREHVSPRPGMLHAGGVASGLPRAPGNAKGGSWCFGLGQGSPARHCLSLQKCHSFFHLYASM